jgi:4-amino-4-deoxy-L-arabinose transferase-like glycosyltransferase
VRELLQRRPLLALGALLAALTLWRLAALALAAPPLFFDEAQYWFWAQDPAFGYYSKPPLIAWAIAASTALFGDGMLAVRLPTLLCYPATALVIFAAARRLYRDQPAAEPNAERIALLAALAYATLPTVSFYSWAATTDALLILCWALGTLALVRLRDSDRWQDWLLLGLAVGLGCLAKYAMLVFGVSAAVWLLLERRAVLKSLKPVVAVALAAAILAPNLLWNAQHDFPTLRHTAEISHLDTAWIQLKPLLEFASSQFAVFGPILMGALLALLFSARRGGLDPRTRLLLWLGLPMLALILAQAALARAFANWAQAAYVPLTIAVVAWLVARDARRWLAASFALHLVFAAIVYHHAQVFALVGYEPSRGLDMTARMRPWPPAGSAVADLLRARPGAALVADERELLSELAYYARDAQPMLAAWNPEREVSDHYRLLYDLATISPPAGREGAPTRFLIVSRKLTQGAIEPYFDRVTELAPIVIVVRSDRTMVLKVFEAERFLGY